MTEARKWCAVHSMLPKYRCHALQVLALHSVVPSLTWTYNKNKPHITCLKWLYTSSCLMFVPSTNDTPPPPEEPSTFDGLEKLNCKQKQMQFMTKAQKRCAVHSMLPKYRSHALQVLTSHSVVPSLTSIYSKQQPHTTCLKWQYNTVTFIGTIAHMYCTLCTLLLHQKSLQSL